MEFDMEVVAAAMANEKVTASAVNSDYPVGMVVTVKANPMYIAVMKSATGVVAHTEPTDENGDTWVWVYTNESGECWPLLQTENGLE